MNYVPDLQTVMELAKRGDNNLVPVFRDIPADLETPVSAYLKVARGEHSFLLESVEGGERLARYSFIGTEPYRVLRCGPYDDPAQGSDPLREIEAELSRYRLSHPKATEPRSALPRFTGGAVGFLAYDAVRHFEPRVPINVPRSAGAARSAVHVRRLASCVRPPPAHDQGRRALPARRRRAGVLPARLLEDRRAGQAAQPDAAREPVSAQPRVERGGEGRIERREGALHRQRRALRGSTSSRATSTRCRSRSASSDGQPRIRSRSTGRYAS